MPTVIKISISLQLLFAFSVLLGGSPAFARKTMPENARTVTPQKKVPKLVV